MSRPDRFTGMTALITGAGSGIGRATAQALVAEGARVMVADIDPEGGSAAALELGEAAAFVELDVADEAAWARGVQSTIDRFGRLDLLVNCAGVGGGRDIESESLEHWNRVLATNMTGAFLGCRAAIPRMREVGGGAIVNVASAAAIKPLPASPAYSAAKAGIVQLTRAVALHCAQQRLNIRCNSVLPGITDTPRLGAGPEADRDALLDRLVATYQPAGRTIRPEEVAQTILFLLSEDAAMATGAAMTLDGGFSL